MHIAINGCEYCMEYPVTKSPEEAIKMPVEKTKMNFEGTQIGYGFDVPTADYTAATVRSACQHWSNKLGRKFVAKASQGTTRVDCVGECPVVAKKPRAANVGKVVAPALAEPATASVADLSNDPWADVEMPGPGLAPPAEPELVQLRSYDETKGVGAMLREAFFAEPKPEVFRGSLCNGCGRALHDGWPCLVDDGIVSHDE